LHAFGDLDGVQTEAKLQHPLGVVFIAEKNVVLVADTYNHKIKVIDPFRNEVFSWLGDGKADLKDENTYTASFNEPSGFATCFDEETNDVKVYVADCNNHCIRCIFYDKGDVKTLEVEGVPPGIRSTNAKGDDDEEDTEEGTTTNKSGGDDEIGMALECDGNQCYPKFF